MDNAIYIALSKQAVQYRKLNVHAQNMANLNTTSYKNNVMMMTDWTIDNGNRQKISFAQDLRDYTDTRDGGMEYTANELDLAISGPGYFVVQTQAGPAYTRAGNFKLDAQGTLVTQEGNPVTGAGGTQIVIPPEAREIRFGENGLVLVDGEEFAQLEVVSFDNEQRLQRLNATLYTSEDPPQPAEEARVSQGFLETSNVESIVELTELITTQRRVSSTSDFMDTAYELQRRAMSSWSRRQQS